LQYCCSVALWLVTGMLSHTVPAIGIAVHKIADTVLGTYFLAVGEKHPSVACWDRLAFLMRSRVTPTRAKYAAQLYRSTRIGSSNKYF